MIRGYPMTVSNVHRLRPMGRLAAAMALSLGLVFGLMAAPVPAAPANPSTAASVARVEVSAIDFKRGSNGEGRLTLRFSGNGATPDLRNQGNSVIVSVGNATLPETLQRPLNVTDFATPVQRVDAVSVDHGTQLVLSTKGNVESLAYQTGNEYVVEITPRAGAQAMGATGGAAAAARPYSGRPVTFNFQDVPVRTVLQLIAEESGLNIVASDTVAGNVTLRLVNVPWDQAMDIVLRAKGLDKRRDGNVVWVAPQAELASYEKAKEDARIELENRVDVVTDYVQINYHSASAIFKALTEAKGAGGGGQGGQNEGGFLSPRGRLVADERTNVLMISDIPKKVAGMRELIAQIDRPVDQVLIEGRIVIATDTFARDLGAKFGIGVNNIESDGNGDVYGSTTNGGGATGRGLNVNLPAGTYTAGLAPSVAYTLLGSNFNLDLELSALQEEGRGEVISNPRIVTANQREGLIKQGKEIGYVTISGGAANGGGAATANVQFKEAVLELRVTPTITGDGRVFLNLNVKKDEISRYIQVSGFGSVPELDKREINTAVLVEDGQTVVIGGVYEFTDRESVSKVPFLGDIPFLGNLFKKKGRQKNKAELLIFVTPKVLSVAKR